MRNTTFLFNVPGASRVFEYNELKDMPAKKRPEKVEVMYCKNTRDRRSMGIMPTVMALAKFG